MFVQILGKSYDINTKKLDLYSKNISELPESIGDLVNLKKLCLKSNQLTTLPESIGELINLRLLDLADNQLKTLPESIGNLTNLKNLCLGNNQLSSLPKSILNIKKSVGTNVSSYEINNLLADTEILIFYELKEELTNLPINLKELWVKVGNVELNHKLPFGCVIKYF
jgi:Leucine-rich repeat (LRR) protein